MNPEGVYKRREYNYAFYLEQLLHRLFVPVPSADHTLGWLYQPQDITTLQHSIVSYLDLGCKPRQESLAPGVLGICIMTRYFGYHPV